MKEEILDGIKGIAKNNMVNLDGEISLRGMEVLCHELAYRAGWWIDPKTGEQYALEANPFIVPTKIGLIHCEASEAIEGDRRDLMDEHLPHRSALECELADIVIRVFDLSGALQLNVSEAIAEKLLYNAQRADHKVENRAKKNGKKY